MIARGKVHLVAFHAVVTKVTLETGVSFTKIVNMILTVKIMGNVLMCKAQLCPRKSVTVPLVSTVEPVTKCPQSSPNPTM